MYSQYVKLDGLICQKVGGKPSNCIMYRPLIKKITLRCLRYNNLMQRSNHLVI